MRLRYILYILVVVLMAPVISGCIYSRELAASKRTIERGYPDLDIDRRFMVTLGPRMLHSAGWIARRVPEEEAFLAGTYLQHLERVKVAVYAVDYYDNRSRSSNAAVVDFEKNGWTLAVRASDENESVWVLYREDNAARVRDIKVVVLSDEELVIARIEGTLNSLLEKFVQDHQGFLEDIMASR